jgi:uncharacterized membrane protein YphA (DoxX/SURF4 family)
MWQPIMHTSAQAPIILIRLIVGTVFLSEGIQKFLFAARAASSLQRRRSVTSVDGVTLPAKQVADRQGGNL